MSNVVEVIKSAFQRELRPIERTGEIQVYYIMAFSRGCIIEFLASGSSPNNAVSKARKYIRKNGLDPDNHFATITMKAIPIAINMEQYENEKLGFRPIVSGNEVPWLTNN